MKPLSRAETDVLLLLIRTGESNKKLGHLLGRSESTIKTQIASALRKTGLDNRVQLALWFYHNYGVKKMLDSADRLD